MIPKTVKVKNKEVPETPGIYLMKNKAGELLYIGKAANLRRRVTSYFTRPHDSRIQKMVGEIARIDYEQTETAIEALILEAARIKEFMPPYNVKEKDDKSFLYVEITKEAYPSIRLARGTEAVRGKRFGPFTSAGSVRDALRIVRRIFPYSTHSSSEYGTWARPCFDAQIGLCPGTCVGAVTKAEYQRTIQHIVTFFDGKKKQLIRTLTKEMNAASKRLDFERAERLRRKIFALQHIQDIALIRDNEEALARHTEEAPRRIEGYDISNISGTSAVGSMVVFTDGKPDKNEYRKFKIKTVEGSNDVGMLAEVLERRFHNDWPAPDLILIDGGVPQVNMARRTLAKMNIRIPIIGLAKGKERKRNDVIGRAPNWVNLATLIKVRDEAHRFAIRYHRALRGARSML